MAIYYLVRLHSISNLVAILIAPFLDHSSVQNKAYTKEGSGYNAMLTVIIPAYNVEGYVAECINSVAWQMRDYYAVDVIIVVDGATDTTLERAQRAVESYPELRMRVIEQENQGLSAARNAGIASATTEYVTFLDADDFWLPGYLDSIMGGIKLFLPDILEYDAMLVSESGLSLYPLSCSSGPAHETSEVKNTDFLARFRCYACTRVFRRSLFASRAFPAGRRFEDMLTIPWLYWSATKVVSLGLPLLAYRQREGSILSTPTVTDVADLGTCVVEAVQMYRSSDDAYWREVALRVFQQACSRTERLHARVWREALSLANRADVASLPVPSRLASWLMIRQPLVYVAMLYLKRRTVDKVIKARSRMHFRASSARV